MNKISSKTFSTQTLKLEPVQVLDKTDGFTCFQGNYIHHVDKNYTIKLLSFI